MYCGNKECLTSYSIWTKRHQYAVQDIQVPPNCLPEGVWDARIQNKQCLLCGGTLDIFYLTHYVFTVFKKYTKYRIMLKIVKYDLKKCIKNTIMIKYNKILKE